MKVEIKKLVLCLCLGAACSAADLVADEQSGNRNGFFCGPSTHEFDVCVFERYYVGPETVCNTSDACYYAPLPFTYAMTYCFIVDDDSEVCHYFDILDIEIYYGPGCQAASGAYFPEDCLCLDYDPNDVAIFSLELCGT
jgi:hypothetical protein